MRFHGILSFVSTWCLFSAFIIPKERRCSNAIPVGIWGGNGYTEDTSKLQRLTDDYGFTIIVSSMQAGYAVNTFLPQMKTAGWKAVLRFADFAPVDDTFDCSDIGPYGNFSYDAWEQSIIDRKYFDFQEDVQSFIDDGTLLGTIILDDVRNYGDFGWDECDPTFQDFDKMGKFIKDNFPGLLVWIRETPEEMASIREVEDDTLQYVDGAIAQYKNISPDTIEDYTAENMEAASDIGVDVICGLNLPDGGDGSSGQEGWRGEGFYAMTATEVEELGTYFIEESCCEYMLLWEFDGEETWPDGTIGAEYFEADDDYKDAASALKNTSYCSSEDATFVYQLKKDGTVKLKECSWLESQISSKIDNICTKKVKYYTDEETGIIYPPAQIACCDLCNSCDDCYENQKTKYTHTVNDDRSGVFKTCKFLSKKSNYKIGTICSRTKTAEGYPTPLAACPQTCGVEGC